MPPYFVSWIAVYPSHWNPFLTAAAPSLIPAPSRPLAIARRLSHVDGLRGLCALYVVLHHICLTVWLTSVNPHPPHGLIKWTMSILYGEERVIMFCVLSGFCLMIPVAKGDGHIRGGIKLFFRRRARRLLPPYYLALVLSLIASWTILATARGSMWDECLPFHWTDVLLHAVMLHNLTDHWRKINYVLWSLAIEWQLYFVFPTFVWLTRRIGIVGAATVAVIAGYVAQFILVHYGILNVKAEYLAYFALGTASAWIVFRTPNLPRAAPISAALWFVSMVGWFSAGELHPFTTHALAAIAFAALLTALGLRPHSWAARIFSFRPLVVLGLTSYSLYMLHPIVIELCQRFIVRPRAGLTANQEFMLLCPLSLGLSLGVGAFFFTIVEKPFMNVPLSPQPARIEELLRQKAQQQLAAEPQTISASLTPPPSASDVRVAPS